MKTLIIFLICGCMLSANQVYSQKQKSNLLPVVTITAESNISEDVRNAFFDKFKDAQNMKWYKINQNYIVKFIMDDQLHQASFKKNGYMVYHIGYGFEKNLPESVRMQVKSQYDEYKIGSVFNVNQDERNIWIVNLENPKYFIIARVENGGMEEISRFKNATGITSPVASNR